MDKLSNARIEVLQNSNGPPLRFERDPHLRLRRTFTNRPLGLPTGIQKYSEAQFVIAPPPSLPRPKDDAAASGGSAADGKRITLSFTAPVRSVTTSSTSNTTDNMVQNHDFYMDAYVFGASEETAQTRMVAVHGISPTASRERWHALGSRIANETHLSRTVRFVALDWHSIDRSDTYQEEFLTMLPKHYFTTPSVSSGGDVDDILSLWGDPDDDDDDDNGDRDGKDDSNKNVSLVRQRRQKMKAMFQHINENCPRSFREAAVVLKAVIQQGLGWGNPLEEDSIGKGKGFIPCFKSWSGGVGMELLLQASKEQIEDRRRRRRQIDEEMDACASPRNAVFRDYIRGAVIMHPGCFESSDNVRLALSGGGHGGDDNIRVLAVWAKDDPLVPYKYSERLLVHDDVQLVSYESGGHGSFDGTVDGQSNFDDDIIDWIKTKFYKLKQAGI